MKVRILVKQPGIAEDYDIIGLTQWPESLEIAPGLLVSMPEQPNPHRNPIIYSIDKVEILTPRQDNPVCVFLTALGSPKLLGEIGW